MSTTNFSDLALGAQFAQAAKRFGGRRVWIRPVQLVVIDVVGSESGQARVQTCSDSRRIAATLSLFQASGMAPLTGHYHLVTAAFDRLAQVLLGQAIAVTLGGVEIVDACIDRCVNDSLRPLDVESHTEVVATQPNNRNL